MSGSILPLIGGSLSSLALSIISFGVKHKPAVRTSTSLTLNICRNSSYQLFQYEEIFKNFLDIFLMKNEIYTEKTLLSKSKKGKGEVAATLPILGKK